MQLFKIPFIISLVLALALPAFGQFDSPPGGQPDEVSQMASFLGLDEDQQTEIRELIDEISPKIQEKEARAGALYRELYEQSGYDFDETEVRETAVRIGDLTAEITALSVILQSRIEGIFTEEQRQTLASMRQQQQQMQQQMQMQQQQPQPGGGSGTDAYGRSPGDPHYGHDHP